LPQQRLELLPLCNSLSRKYAVLENAFLLFVGAPEPGAHPCIRQRVLPDTAGDRQGPPERVLASQRGLASISPVLRG